MVGIGVLSGGLLAGLEVLRLEIAFVSLPWAYTRLFE